MIFMPVAMLNAQIPNNAEDICPLLVGEIMPDVPVAGLDGEAVSLHQVISKKPTVLIRIKSILVLFKK